MLRLVLLLAVATLCMATELFVDVDQSPVPMRMERSPSGCNPNNCRHPNGVTCTDGECICTYQGTYPSCCPDCGLSTNPSQCNTSIGVCQCNFGGRYPDCCPDCTTTNGADAFCKVCDQTCVCRFGGIHPACCPEACVHANGAFCSGGTCVCRHDGTYPDCCPNCQCAGKICCENSDGCRGGAEMGECYCENGIIRGSDKCCDTDCGEGKVCDENGNCVDEELIGFGQDCGTSANSCVRINGVKCKQYDCCANKAGEVPCNKKFCLCETEQNYIFDSSTLTASCKLVTEKPKQDECLDAPDGFNGSP